MAMSLTVLLTGFGPFPGAPANPTVALVEKLARRRHPALAGVRRVAHVFATSYAAVDRELPALIAREKLDAVVMFGLAARTQHIRIETRARNAIARLLPDATGMCPSQGTITAGGPASLALAVPGQRLVAAVRARGLPAAPSRDAGRYLCNYLCWRASEMAGTAGGPRLVAFVHVPKVRRIARMRKGGRSRQFTADDLLRAGEAIVVAAVAAARASRLSRR
jgi:pyroglutamyl-peptidase